MTEQNAADLSKSASGDDGRPEPPASNQRADEPFPTTPEESAQAGDGRAEAGAGTSSIVPGEQGEEPYPVEVDDVRAAANAGAGASMPADATGGVPSPGDSRGVSVPAVQAAAGTSEQSEKVQGVHITSLAPPGKPDGEVDTRG